jgi:hypothetical protein
MFRQEFQSRHLMTLSLWAKADISPSLIDCPLFARKPTSPSAIIHVRFVPKADIVNSI